MINVSFPCNNSLPWQDPTHTIAQFCKSLKEAEAIQRSLKLLSKIIVACVAATIGLSVADIELEYKRKGVLTTPIEPSVWGRPCEYNKTVEKVEAKYNNKNIHLAIECSITILTIATLGPLFIMEWAESNCYIVIKKDWLFNLRQCNAKIGIQSKSSSTVITITLLRSMISTFVYA